MASDPGPDPGPSGGQRGWWLEDAIPGTVLRHPGGRTIGATEHVWLAWVTHNVSDIHGDAHAARRSEWGQPLVLGMLTAAIVIGLAAPATPEPRDGAIGMSDGWSSIRLTGVVLAGDTLTTESAIHAVDAAAPERAGRVRRTIRGRNQRGEVVAVIEEERRVPKRPEASPRVVARQREKRLLTRSPAVG
jgi:acyl dehydratase